ncbi:MULTISPECIES: DUF1441 family protein [Pseudoxanthomonas]|uniref:DUF1441 family protein n=1 Tax=Pseudoxanthomonas winnipegensis TaxID=2480810 RepID=A0A4Q8M5Q4_9GAMM|nr:DUF1441 family protein [Pseudoxanthomonas winnipegensis]TAA42478.1 DUF1441 family protein [Pseudoxanthomonas winnipegensis]
MGEVSAFQAGWSIARLADEFRMDRRTATKRIREAGVAPLGKRGGHDVYRLADVAPALVDPLPSPAGDEGVIDPHNLPPPDRLKWFQSENERLKLESSMGLLVPALEVEARFAELVKTLVMFMDTLPDVLERDVALSPKQVQAVQESCDRVRQEMYERVVDGDVRDSA